MMSMIVKINKSIQFIFWVLFCCLLSVQSHSQNLPDITEYATDFTSTLSEAQLNSLRTELSNFQQENGSQIVVVIINSTGDSSIEDYATVLFRKLKIGRKNIDDGVLMLIAKADRRMRIEVGYGLEGAIPDIKAQRIIDEQITPAFKKDNYYQGIENGVSSLKRLIEGEDLPPPKSSTKITAERKVFIVLMCLGFY